MTIDDIRDIAMNIVDTFVNEGLCPNCTNTNNNTEFEYQDIIFDNLCNIFNIKEQ